MERRPRRRRAVRDQKPACTNGMATLVALKIYQGNKNKYYLDWGKKFYAWMYQNLRDSTGVYSNDKKLDGSAWISWPTTSSTAAKSGP
ncbi:MAG: hypothetical protein EOO37_03620 [Cytophagaceae bacterium]|nr:MAG: hypothetical protein EOO37_03620 [Cytophagaceae bacterium]